MIFLTLYIGNQYLFIAKESTYFIHNYFIRGSEILAGSCKVVLEKTCARRRDSAGSLVPHGPVESPWGVPRVGLC